MGPLYDVRRASALMVLVLAVLTTAPAWPATSCAQFPPESLARRECEYVRGPAAGLEPGDPDQSAITPTPARPLAPAPPPGSAAPPAAIGPLPGPSPTAPPAPAAPPAPVGQDKKCAVSPTLQARGIGGMFDRLLAREGVRVTALLMPGGRLVGTVTNAGDRTIASGLLEVVLSPSAEKVASAEEYRAKIQTLFVSFPEPIPPQTTRSFEAAVPLPDGDRPWDCYDFMFYS